jgi:nitroimidazol reductase NimA-like FMN-containing flavoprotein (pyridoxamine 5'-phosphate oxidase superfamily)
MQERPFSDDEVQRALDGPATVVLATINPDGSPLATPMWFVHDADGLGMVSVDGLQKIRNLHRDPRVSVVVETRASSGLQCVIVQGAVAFLDSAADRRSLAFGPRALSYSSETREALGINSDTDTLGTITIGLQTIGTSS